MILIREAFHKIAFGDISEADDGATPLEGAQEYDKDLEKQARQLSWRNKL